MPNVAPTIWSRERTAEQSAGLPTPVWSAFHLALAFARLRQRRHLTRIAGSCDRESLSTGTIDVIHSSIFDKRSRQIRYQYADAVDLNGDLVLFWLIQSQSHFGTASAHSLNVDAQVLAPLRREYRLQLLFSRVRYLHDHTSLS